MEQSMHWAEAWLRASTATSMPRVAFSGIGTGEHHFGAAVLHRGDGHPGTGCGRGVH